MNTHEMLRRFGEWREADQRLVLASVYETAGSTYSKAGTQMLITGDGDFQGMLSGGCLEGDLAERAALVSTSGEPQAVSYDLGGTDDELFGLGVGCDGTMRIFLQPLPRPDYQPFAGVAECLRGDEPAVLATVIESGATVAESGQFALIDRQGVRQTTLSGPVLRAVEEAAAPHLESGSSATGTVSLKDGDVTVLFAAIVPPPRLLVLGAGLDAVPVVDFAARLGWRVTVRDHRPAYFEKADFGNAEQCIAGPAEELAAEDLQPYSAVMVMSHHLATDRTYLRALAATEVPYTGLLGPSRRREQLLADLDDAGADLAARLHGPAGLDLGGRSAESIALSIVAEIHATLMRAGKAGRRLGAPGRG